MRSWLYVCRPSRIKVSVAGSKIAAVHHRTQWLHSSSSESSGGTPERVIFSGIQPTGVPHLGNYLGALRPWVQLQDEKTSKDQLNFSIVDLHALTVPQDPKQLESWRMDTYVALLAVGLDTKRSRVFFQSQLSAHTELMWILSTVASTGYLARMTQWKSKLNLPEDATLQDGKAKSALKLGLFSYPVLQAADILLYKTTHVPVGQDQQQHVEFARAIAASFNHLYGHVFNLPELVMAPARRIMSLTDPRSKMSKSDPKPNSRILITDDEQTIHEKFKTALTDSTEDITYDPEKRPGVSNLLDILRYTRDGKISSRSLAAEFKTSSLRVLKQTVANAVVRQLREVRENFLQLRANPKSLLPAMRESHLQAGTSAAATMLEVREAVGLRGPSMRSHQSRHSFTPTEE